MGHPPAEEARSSKACCASPEAASRCRRVRVEAAGATLLRPSRFSASCAFAFVRRERPVETRAAGVGLKAWVSRPGRPPLSARVRSPLSARVRGILAAALGDQSYPLPARTFYFAAFPVPLFMGEKATSGFNRCMRLIDCLQGFPERLACKPRQRGRTTDSKPSPRPSHHRAKPCAAAWSWNTL